MSNTKIQLIVIATVMLLAGAGLWMLMNPGTSGTGGGNENNSDRDRTELFDGDGEMTKGGGVSGTEDVIEGEEKQRKTETVPANGNPHVEALNARIKALEEAEWSKKDYIRLRSDIEGKRDARLITTEIAKSLSGNLFNAYLITVKEAALKVIKTSSNLSDLSSPHEELKRLKPMVTDTRVTEVTDMTHAIYTIPYYTDRLEKDIAKGDMTDEVLMKEAKKIGGKIDGLPGRFALFRTSPLVKAVCRQGGNDLGRKWGEELITRKDGKIEGYSSQNEYDEGETSRYRDELMNFSGSKYLASNSDFMTWTRRQTALLDAHAAADEEFNLYASMGGADDCSVFKQFNFYYEKCKNKTTTPNSNN